MAARGAALGAAACAGAVLSVACVWRRARRPSRPRDLPVSITLTPLMSEPIEYSRNIVSRYLTENRNLYSSLFHILNESIALKL